jgi:hypothetical protein
MHRRGRSLLDLSWSEALTPTFSSASCTGSKFVDLTIIAGDGRFLR